MTAYQSYRYFHQYRSEVIKLLEFNEAIKERAKTYAQTIFGHDKTHKICVHIRRSDFISSTFLLPTDEIFTKNAIQYVSAYIRSRGLTNNFSVYAFGDDKLWIKKFIQPSNALSVYYSPENISSEVEMCLAVMNCDSLIMTASSSTYSFWIAYLMKSTLIFYRKLTSKLQFTDKELHSADLFLPGWKPIEEFDNNNNDNAFF